MTFDTKSILSTPLMGGGMSTAQSIENLQKQSEKLQTGESVGVEDPKVKKAATQFEALLLQQMMKSMWSTVNTKDSLLGSKDEDTYRDMLNQALSESIAGGQGIGIKGIIAKELGKGK